MGLEGLVWLWEFMVSGKVRGISLVEMNTAIMRRGRVRSWQDLYESAWEILCEKENLAVEIKGGGISLSEHGDVEFWTEDALHPFLRIGRRGEEYHPQFWEDPDEVVRLAGLILHLCA